MTRSLVLAVVLAFAASPVAAIEPDDIAGEWVNPATGTAYVIDVDVDNRLLQFNQVGGHRIYEGALPEGDDQSGLVEFIFKPRNLAEIDHELNDFEGRPIPYDKLSEAHRRSIVEDGSLLIPLDLEIVAGAEEAGDETGDEAWDDAWDPPANCRVAWSPIVLYVTIYKRPFRYGSDPDWFEMGEPLVKQELTLIRPAGPVRLRLSGKDEGGTYRVGEVLKLGENFVVEACFPKAPDEDRIDAALSLGAPGRDDGTAPAPAAVTLTRSKKDRHLYRSDVHFLTGNADSVR